MAAQPVVDAITTEAGNLGPQVAAIGALGVGLSLSSLMWPKGVAFFKKVFKIG